MSDVPTERMSAATSLVGTSQQISLGAGVALGGLALDAATRFRVGQELTAGDFWPAFLLVALLSASASLFFRRLDPEAGADMAGRIRRVDAPSQQTQP